MQDSKLIKIFKSLTPEECKYLRWFVQSNFFNTDPNLLRLYDALAKHYPEFHSKTLTKETLYDKVFPDQSFSDAKWRNLATKMTKLLEDYLVWLEIEQQETTKQKLLTTAYGRRNLFEQFEKSTNELSARLEKESEKSADALRERMLVNLQYYHHPQSAKVNNLDRLQTAMDDLDYYYVAEKLRLACDLKVFENMVKVATTIRLKENIINLLQEEDWKNFIYLEIYGRMFLLLDQQPRMEVFQATFEYFSGVSNELSKRDCQFGLINLLNFAINQANKGLVEFRLQVLNLYKFGLEKKMWINEGRISASTFINIASHGSSMKEFHWTEDFINKHEQLLDKATSLEAKTISLGFLTFYRKDYSTTIKLLLNFPFEDFNTNLNAKTLLIRSYFGLFELDKSYFQLFLAYHKSLDKFIRREKMLSKNKKIWFLNFGVELVKLGKLKYQGKVEALIVSRFKLEIESKEMILKQWLIEKLLEQKK